MVHPGAKEFLDVSLSKRKINVKYAEPISLTRGVPFIMATNDFFGDYGCLVSKERMREDYDDEFQYNAKYRLT